MPALIGAIGTLIAKILGDNVLRWVAMKGILLFLFVVILPLVFNNFMADMLQMLFGMVDENSGSLGSINPTFSMTGLAAWFSEQCKFTECISVIVSALIAKVTLRQIPFVRF